MQPSVRRRALEVAAAYAVLAPSVHNTQPWRIELEPDRLSMRADRSRWLTAGEPTGRELVQSVGTALFNARVALADSGWASEVDRLPCPDDPDLLAVVRPYAGAPDPALAALAPAVTRRRTNRRRFTGAHLPDAVLRRLTEIAESEGVLLIPVVDDAHRRLVARLTQQADGLRDADPAYRADVHRGTTRPWNAGDGIAAEELPTETRPDIDQPMVLLATRADDPPAWLRAGEALEHVLLELTRLGWVAGPLTPAIEVPLTPTRLWNSLTWSAHPQMVLRVGQAPPTPGIPRQRRADAAGRLPSGAPALVPEPATSVENAPAGQLPRRRPVSDVR
jgi:hypothetical protein